ncbi:type IV secretion system protein [Methylomonas sp. MO1]|uniref:virB8 family protein n=1 Tax=Methylomonas sp. MO1 TaxID=3073619 RepID=UPI0028A4C096|nr:type IV secretion system protein [Methylomonas sp. MO1]MDT4292363.1 type IV secretion system protein [Methylomonas sp. MO1]
MKRDPQLESYLQEASTWEADKLRDALKQIKYLRWIIIGLLAITGSLAWAIKGLTPLKTTQPYVVRVDNSTGIVDVVPIYNGEAELNELTTRHLLTHYQIARERYFYAIAETDYETVGAFNNTKLNDEWAQAWQETNPESPLVKYKDGTTVTVHVKGITFLEPESGARDTAQIRFTTEKRQGGNGSPQVTHWLSTIKYAYGEPSKNDKERSLNQLGLRIISYHKEPEVIAEQTQPLNGGPK